MFSTSVARAAIAVAIACSAACGHAAPPPPPPAESPAPAADEHHAPHGGHLLELGEEFAQVELVLDPGAGSLTAYFLDGDAEESVRLVQPTVTVAINQPAPTPPRMLVLAAKADILTGETVGDSSEFSITTSSLLGLRKIDGKLVDVLVRGKVFHDLTFAFP